MLWKELGFSTKASAKRVLDKTLALDTDYILLNIKEEQIVGSGGQNKEIIKLTLKAAQEFALHKPK